MRAVLSRSSDSRWMTASGIHSAVVYSCSARSARLLPIQSSTAERSAMPVIRATASAAYELSPATRASTQKNWSVVMSGTQPPRQRVSSAINGCKLWPGQERGLGYDLGLQSVGGDDRDFFQAGLRRHPGARVDQVVKVAPSPPPHAAGRCTLIAQQQCHAGEGDRPARTVRPKAA